MMDPVGISTLIGCKIAFLGLGCFKEGVLETLEFLEFLETREAAAVFVALEFLEVAD